MTEDKAAAPQRPAARDGQAPALVLAAIALIVLVGFILRIAGISHGLPYAFNLDESNYYVTRALKMVNGGLNPHWFVNPPAFTYLLAIGFKVLSGGGRGFLEVYARNPEPVWLLARSISALLGSVAVALVYATGAKLFNRTAGLIAAAILATGFLPVFYGHLALNDSPLLAPLALALFGAAGIHRDGRTRDAVLAGVGLGLACATKYTGGMVAVTILFAILSRREGRARLGGIVAGLAVISFVIANPYSLLDFGTFIGDVGHQSEASSGAGKLGQTGDGGVLYYLGTIAWGLGWLPAALAAAGSVRLIREDRDKALMLLVAPLGFAVFMGLHARWFARWGMPLFPFAALLAGWGAVWIVEAVRSRNARLALPVAVAIGLLACVQGAWGSIHVDQVLSRTDTRTIARKWMFDNIPHGSQIVVEPGVVPEAWLRQLSRGTEGKFRKRRWKLWNNAQWKKVGFRIDEYPAVLSPRVIDRYATWGYCWVVTSSTQRGRVERQPERAPAAVAYYHALVMRSRLAFRSSPWKQGAKPVPFSFDDSFDYLPSAYERPGPVISIYRLKGGRCS